MMPKVITKRCVGRFRVLFWWIYLCMLCISGIFFTQLGVTDSVPEMITLIVTLIGTAGVFAWFSANEKDTAAAFLMFCGYMVRVIYRYSIESGILTGFYASAGDAAHFWEVSSNMYFGKHNNIVLTKYPYLLRGFYEVFGNNRYLAVYINIIFWALGSVVLMKLGRKAGLRGIRKYILYAIWAVLPESILIGTDLLRENIMVFFDMYSFYTFLKWMESGKKSCCIGAFLLAAPAAYLHTASIALWFAYIAIAAFWNTREKRFMLSQKTVWLFLLGIVGCACILFSPLRNVFGSYIGADISLYGITHRPYEIGGSDYLQWMDCQNWLQFIPYTLLRMFYFLFAPMPWEARGVIDLISFVMDGLLVFGLLVYMWCKRKNKKKQSAIYASLVCVLALSGIFAWGVRNAGAAIRHRMLVWGILIMGTCMAMGKTGEENVKGKSNFD